MPEETSLDAPSVADSRRRPKPPRGKLADYVAAVIEDRILDGRLLPGARLPTEPELAQEFEVSRSVIRDAMRALATRRLINVRQGAGTVVAEPSGDEYAEAVATHLLRSECTVGELWSARLLLETELAVAAMRSGNADWTDSRAALADFERAIKGRSADAEVAHSRFHTSLMTASGNRAVELLFVPMHEVVIVSSRVGWQAADPSSIGDDFALHPPILAAAEAGDEDALREAMAAHYYFINDLRYIDFKKLRLAESPVARATLYRGRMTRGPQHS